MKKMHNTIVTIINKDTKEYLSAPNNPWFSENTTINYGVDMGNDNIKENKQENVDLKNYTNLHKVNNDLKTQNEGLVDNIIKQETHECRSITHDTLHENNSYKSTNPLKQNDTWSYIKEFDLFLQTYKENYVNQSTCTVTNSSTCIAIETQELMNDINKYQNIEQTSNCTHVCENCVTDLPKRNNSDIDGIIRGIHTEEANRNGVKNTIDSAADIVKPFNLFNTEMGLNYDIEVKNYNYTYNFVDDSSDELKKDDAFIEENDNIISISSENSELSIDAIHLDHSVNYSIYSLGKMEFDFADEFQVDEDSEGYNSSDFEFIDEKEACAAGIINKSDTNIKYENLINNNVTTKEEFRANFDEPGPSGIRRGILDYNTPKYNSSNNSDSELEDPKINHIIPEGEHLYELFAEPWVAYDYQAENKAFFSNRAMNLEVENIGFNVDILQRRHQENAVDDSIKQEAIKNARKILMMYPMENTNRKGRRF